MVLIIHAPVVGGEVTPVVDGEVTPVVGGEVTPVVGGEVTPVVGSEVTPAVCGKVTPVVGGKVAPLVGYKVTLLFLLYPRHVCCRERERRRKQMTNRRCTDQEWGGTYQKDITLKMKVIPLQGRYAHGARVYWVPLEECTHFCLLFVCFPVHGDI